MPFKSEAQRRFMYATDKKLAKKFEKHTPKGKKLPEKVDKEAMVMLRDLISKKRGQEAPEGKGVYASSSEAT